jgi:hypothetical protein
MDRLAREDHTIVISCEMDLKYVTNTHNWYWDII